MEVHKALTFRASSIGDCLMGKYVLENIYAAYPSAQLGIVVGSRSGMIRDLLRAYPWLTVIEANRRKPGSILSIFKDFHGSDAVITQYAGKQGGVFSLPSKIVARLLAKQGGLVGFQDASAWNHALYDALLPVRADVAVIEHDRSALRALDIPVTYPFPKLEFIEDSSVISRFNLKANAYTVVHLFAGNAKRGLSRDKKREVLQALVEEGASIVVSGGAADREEALAVTQGLPATVIAGEATLQDMMNLIHHSQKVVSIDTGMAHIAAHLKKPLVVLRTCLAKNWWITEQYGDIPLTVLSHDEVCSAGHRDAEYPACVNTISSQEVISAWKKQ